MSMYEGPTLILEKQAVVLDLGARYTKFGFTGEAGPRCIVPSEFPCERTRQPKRLHDYTTPEELYDNLQQMLHLLYFRHVLVNPKDRKVVVVESLLSPTLFRETLAKVLYCHYEVASVVWAPSSLMCAVALGAPPAALVVELGWEEALVCAVVHAAPVLCALTSAPLAARALHGRLLELLREDNGELQLTPKALEDIQVKTCFVTRLERAQAYESGAPPPPPPDVRYPLRDGALRVSGRARELAAECLFPRDNEHAGLAETILDTILRCPVDTRRPLAENILVTGGTANLPGIRSRLAEELRHHASQPRYADKLFIQHFKFHTPPAKDNYTAWLGGSILGATEALSTRALTREAYHKERRVRDWVNLLDNTPPAHPHWSAVGL